jgi:hypothetical protein
VNDALRQVSQTVSELIGRPLDLPEVTPDTVPSEAIAAIEAATGLDLPDNFGSVVVYDADELATIQQAFRLFNGIVLLLILLVIATTVAALWLSPRKRRTLLQLTVGFAIVLVVERRLAIAGADSLVGNVAAANQAAARAVVDALLGTLLRYTGWLLAVALVTLAIALLTGPYRWATAVRTGVVDLGRSVSGATARASEGGVGVWVAGHRDVLMLSGAAVGVLLLLLFDLSLLAVLVLSALLVLFELFVYRAGVTQGS